MLIKFSDMVQINQKTKFIRRIRICIEMKDKNGFYAYEYQKENQKWFAYNVEIMIKIANAIENDQMILSINQSYDIDLDKSIEINSDTKVTRKIHRIKSSVYIDFSLSVFFLFETFFSGEITVKYFNNIQ